MLIRVKNKDNLIIGEFKFKCSIGKNGFKKNKTEGDKSTPKGTFSLGKIYYRSDKVNKPETKLKTRIITKYLGWCNDPKDRRYNKEVTIKKNLKCERLFRKDAAYNYLLVINYNNKKFLILIQ